MAEPKSTIPPGVSLTVARPADNAGIGRADLQDVELAQVYRRSAQAAGGLHVHRARGRGGEIEGPAEGVAGGDGQEAAGGLVREVAPVRFRATVPLCRFKGMFSVAEPLTAPPATVSGRCPRPNCC